MENNAITNLNVRVALRIRPLNAKEKLSDCSECVDVIPEEPNQVVIGQNRSFTFDRVFPSSTSQSNIFDLEVNPLITKFLQGFHVTIMAYGQTSSGKSYTMGTSLDGNIDIEPETQGIISRAISTIFDKVSEQSNYELKASFLELYNEDLVDLFNPSADKKGLQIREDSQGGIYVYGSKEMPINSSKQVLQLLQQGLLCRTTASTDMNLVSSRSHAIFIITLKQSKTTQTESGETQTTSIVSKLNFVDLAGSERLKRTNATGDRAKESISINSGLLALGNVISALGDESRKALHVPYRDSKLTRLLQDSLGGNSETLMVACISPSDSNFMETLNTLKYANRARNIKNRVSINEDVNGNSAAEISQLKRQINTLKKELMMYNQSGSSFNIANPESELAKDRILTLETDIRQLNLTIMQLENRVKVLSSELLLIQAERDTLRITKEEEITPNNVHLLVKPLIEQYSKEIVNLKCKIKEMGSNPRMRPISSESIYNSPRLSRSLTSENISETLMEAKEEIRKTSELLSSKMIGDEEEKDDEIATKLELERIQNDIQLKEKLVQQLEYSQQEQAILKSKFEEKVQLLHESLMEVQRERDSALQRKIIPVENEKIEKQKYEERVKRLEDEIADLKRRHNDDLKNLKNRTNSNEALLESMKSSIQSLKHEKNRLIHKLKEESIRLRNIEQTKDIEIRRLKKKDQKTTEQAKKLERSFEHQKILLKKRYEETQSMRNKIKTLLKYNSSKRAMMEKNLSDSDLPIENDEASGRRPHSSPHTDRRNSRKRSDPYPDEKFVGSNSIDFVPAEFEVKKKIFEGEISNCVEQKQKTALMEQLIQKRDELANEKQELQVEKQRLANYLAEHPEATEDDYKQLNDVEDRLEILDAEIKYLTNGRLRQIQYTSDDENVNEEKENSFENALRLLKSMTNSEAQEMFQFLIDEMVNLKVGQRTIKTQEGALNKTVMDLRHTLQLMRKAAVETALENESKIQELTKKYEMDIKALERGTRIRPTKRNSDDLPPTAPAEPPESRRGRKLPRSNSVNPQEEKRKTSNQQAPVKSVESLTEPQMTPAISTASLAMNNNAYDTSGPFEMINNFSGHSGAVYALTLNETEHRLFSASQDATVKVWDLNSSQNIQTYSGHSGFVRCLALKDSTLYSGSQSIIRVWDCNSNKCIRQLQQHSEDIECLATKDNLLFAGSSDTSISVWDVRNLKCLSTLNGHKGAVFTMDFYNDFLLTGSRDHLIKVYNTTTFDLVCTLHPPHYDVVQALLVLGNELYSGSRDYSLKKWNLTQLDKKSDNGPPKVKLSQTVLSAHRDWIKALATITNPSLNENPVILSGSRDGMIKFWDSATMEKLHEQRLHGSSLNCMAIYQSKYVVTGSNDRSIRFWGTP